MRFFFWGFMTGYLIFEGYLKKYIEWNGRVINCKKSEGISGISGINNDLQLFVIVNGWVTLNCICIFFDHPVYCPTWWWYCSVCCKITEFKHFKWFTSHNVDILLVMPKPRTFSNMIVFIIIPIREKLGYQWPWWVEFREPFGCRLLIVVRGHVRHWHGRSLSTQGDLLPSRRTVVLWTWFTRSWNTSGKKRVSDQKSFYSSSLSIYTIAIT